MIDLSRNESPYGMAPDVVERLCRPADYGSRYPERDAATLRGALARCWAVPPEQVIVGAGGTQVLLSAMLALGGPVIYTERTWPGYRDACQAAGMVHDEIPMDGYRLPVDVLADRLRRGAGAVIACNPHNPVGTALSAAELRCLLDASPGDAVPVIDEAYAEFAGPDFASAVDFVRDGARALVVRTFSKAYGLAGLRVGYGLGHPDVIARMTAVSLPFTVSGPAQLAALASLADTDFAARCVSLIRDARDQAISWLGNSGYGAVPSKANFILIEVPVSSTALCAVLEGEHRIRVCDGASMGFARHIRVTVGTPSAMRAMAVALRPAIERAGRVPESATRFRDPAGVWRDGGTGSQCPPAQPEPRP